MHSDTEIAPLPAGVIPKSKVAHGHGAIAHLYSRSMTGLGYTGKDLVQGNDEECLLSI